MTNKMLRLCCLAFALGVARPALCAPANDSYANATAITGVTGSSTNSNSGATRQSGEPVILAGCSNSVWFRWIAPRTGKWSFDTDGSRIDTVLAVFRGATLSGSTLLASNVDISVGSSYAQVSFLATAGTEYRVMVDGQLGAQDGFVLSWCPNPINDDFLNATVLNGESGRVSGNNIGATLEPGEPDYGLLLQPDEPHVVVGASVWYRWTAPRTGLVVFDTAESEIDTILAVFTGSSLGGLTLVKANNNMAPDGSSTVIFNAAAGVTYSVAVASRFTPAVMDQFKLRWGYVPLTPPANDNFANATLLEGSAGLVYGSNFGATREPGEPFHASMNTIGASIWFQWGPPSNSLVVFDAAGSSFNTRLALYTGNDVSHLTLVTNNEESALGPFITSVRERIEYYIAVDGYLDLSGFPPFNAPTGYVALHWMTIPATPANDNFKNAITIQGTNGTIAGSNFGGTNELLQPGPTTNGVSVWYKWTAPVSGRFTFDTAVSGFDTILAVFTGNAMDKLTWVADNDDYTYPLRTSGVSFNAISGTRYNFCIDGFLPIDGPPKVGRFNLNWSLRYTDPMQPSLTITPNRAIPESVVSWPAWADGYILQSTPDFTPPVLWTNVATGSAKSYTNHMSDPSAFFRLVRP